jgi:DNA adenine methylase
MPTTESPLRYPGGKTQLAPFVADLLTINDLDRGVYAEPFAGGAGLAWRLLLSGKVAEVWLNDIDPAIFNFWRAVLDHPDALCDRIERTAVTLEMWKKQRAVLTRAGGKPLDIAFATLFLNRTNRSGILAGGVIGGKEQAGNYKLDCRFNKAELIDKIRRIASYRDVVKLSQLDARLCIPSWAKALPKRGLLNIDPPYFVKGQELYTNFYTPENHADLAKTIRRLKCPWMLTYDDAPAVEALYKGLPLYRKGLIYYAQVKRRAIELLILSRALVPPGSLVRDSLARAA